MPNPIWISGDTLDSTTLNYRATSVQTFATSFTTASISTQGQLYFSVLSLTTNGAELGFRSGNTIYKFFSTGVG